MNTLKDSNWKYKEVINLIGEEKIQRLHSIIGSEKISFATILHFIRNEKISSAIQNGIPFKKIALAVGVSKMTVYRNLKGGIKK